MVDQHLAHARGLEVVGPEDGAGHRHDHVEAFGKCLQTFVLNSCLADRIGQMALEGIEGCAFVGRTVKAVPGCAQRTCDDDPADAIPPGRIQQIAGAENIRRKDFLLAARCRRELRGAMIDRAASVGCRFKRGRIAQIAKDPLAIEIIGRRIVALGPQQHAHVRALGNQRPHQVRAKVAVGAGDEDFLHGAASATGAGNRLRKSGP